MRFPAFLLIWTRLILIALSISIPFTLIFGVFIYLINTVIQVGEASGWAFLVTFIGGFVVALMVEFGDTVSDTKGDHRGADTTMVVW